MKLIFVVFAACVVLLSGRLIASSNHDLNWVMRNSASWPDKVKLTNKLVIPGTDKNLPAGWSGILSRVDSKGCLIDFGREGVLYVPIEDTNILEESAILFEKNSKGGGRKNGLYIRRLWNKFFKYDDGQLRSCTLADFGAPKYLLVTYVNFGDSSSEEWFEQMITMRTKFSEFAVEPICLTLDKSSDVVAEAIIESEWPYMCMFRWLTPAYVKMFANQSSSSGYGALIDVNGRLIEEGDIKHLINNLKLVIEADSEMYRELPKATNLTNK